MMAVPWKWWCATKRERHIFETIYFGLSRVASVALYAACRDPRVLCEHNRLYENERRPKASARLLRHFGDLEP